MALILIFELKNSKLHRLFADIQSIFHNLDWLSAPDEETLLELAEEASPDVILIGDDEADSGLNVCRHLKQINRLREIPVLFLVGKDAPPTVRKKALEAGADAFLSYPADEFEIRAQLEVLFKINAANRKKNSISQAETLSDESIGETGLLFRNLMAHIPQRVFIKDLNSTYIACNESFAADLGITREEIAGKNDFDFYPAELAERYRSDDQEVIISAKSKDIQEPYFRKGEKRWVHTTKVPFRDFAGKITGVLAILEDVTEQRRMEDQLLQNEKKYRAIFENVQDVYFEIAPDGTITEISPSIAAMSGGSYTPEKLIGNSMLNYYADLDARNKFLDDLRQQKSVSDYEINFINGNGSVIPCSVSARLQSDESGNANKITGTLRNITQRKQIESELLFSNELFSKIFSLTPVPISINDLTNGNRFVDCNKAFFNITGFSEEDIIGKDAAEIGLYANPEEQATALNQLKEEGKITNFEHRYLKKNGKTGVGLLSLESFRLDGKKYAITVNHDITELKNTENDLIRAKEQALESETRLRAILDNSIDAISLSKDGINLYGNHAYLKLFGYETPDKFIGSSVLDDIAPVEKERIKNNIRNRSKGEKAPSFYESIGVRRNGEEFPFEIRVGTYIEGGAQYSVGIIHDITERKKNEEKLCKANRLYNVIRQINRAIVRQKDKSRLFDDVCRIAIEYGNFRMAWIGIADGNTRLITPYSVAGYDEGYLSAITKISVEDVPEGNGPTGIAFREGRHGVCNDYATDPAVKIWREEALKREYRSSISLPLKEMGKTIAALTIYSSVPGFFDQEEMDLLEEVALDISFALDTFKITEQHQLAVSALTKSEEKYRRLTENMKDVVWVMDTETLRFTYVSPSVQKLRGYTPEEVMAEPISAAMAPEQAERLANMLIQVKAAFVAGTLPENYLYHTEEISQPCKDGSVVQTEVISTLFLNPLTGKVELHGVTRDITERRNAEKKLRESEQRYRLLFDNSFDAFALTTSDGQILSANPAMCKMFGLTEEEICKKGREGIIDFSDPGIRQALRERAETGHFFGEVTGIRKDGTKFPVELSSTLFTSQDGTAQASVVMRDITSRKQAEAEIIRAHERFQVLFEQAPLGMALVDTRTGEFYQTNAKFLEIIGYSGEKLNASYWQSIIQPDDAANDVAFMERFRRGEINGFKLEKRYTRPDESIIWVSLAIARLELNRSEYSYHLAMIEDITSRKKEEEQRRILLRAVEQSPVSIVITDTAGSIQYVNPKFSQTTGYSWSEAIGQNPRILKSSSTPKEEYEQLWTTIFSGKEWHGEFRNLRKNGESYFESALISPVFDASGKITQFVAVKEDITERKKAESRIRTLSTAVEQSPTMIAITDSEGKIEFTNQQFSEFLQFSAAEVFGKLPRIFRPGYLAQEDSEQMWKLLKAGKVWETEHQNTKKDGTKFWEQVTVFPLNNEKGQPTNYIIIQDDISEKKQLINELVDAKNKAEESDRLKSAFLANMSHEIRTPLNSIIGFSELLLDPDFEQNRQAEFVYMIKQSGANLLSIISNIMDISRLESGLVTIRREEFSLNRLILEIKKEYFRLAEDKPIDFRVNVPAENMLLVTDESKVKQVLVNFLGNAFKFTAHGFVEIGFIAHENQVHIYVKDSGIGIPHEFHGKIFERFRQVETATTRRYGGNGLGLAISKQLAELLGGKVWIESELHYGSTFYLSLPIAPEEAKIQA